MDKEQKAIQRLKQAAKIRRFVARLNERKEMEK